jgi:tRNA modification GTPase
MPALFLPAMRLPRNLDGHDEATIIAQCTPSGSGALALLRLSGNDSLTIATNMSRLASAQAINEVLTHTVHYGWIIDHEGTTLDQVMIIVMHAPKTFTGQHVVEITCHNNPFVIEAIIQRAFACGARIAQNGEFTKRAYLHNKIDLIQAEAINELIHANTQSALKKSLAQLEGSFSHWIAAIESDLYKALALSEASFEFLDEEMEFGNTIKELLCTTLGTISTVKKSFDQQQQIRQGIRIAFIGSVNAGKSSLFNALLNKERAIVTPIAGTTRDTIEAGIYKQGNYWTLIDTAGLRITDDSIEQEGILRSRVEAQQADIIVLIYDGSRPLTVYEQEIYQELWRADPKKIILVCNKIDLPIQAELMPDTEIPQLRVAGKTKFNIEQIEIAIASKIQTLFQNIEAPFLLNQRHYHLLVGLEQQLHEIIPMLEGLIAYELLSYHLKDALAQLSELTGKSVSERGMDTIFREFCIGK